MAISPTTKVAGLKKVFVLSEQVIVTPEPRELVTILGSCVAVCLWDRVNKIGGMNHFLLPETVNKSNSLKGGIASTRLLIKLMLSKSPNPKNIDARVFGGANRFFKEESFLHVGLQNVEAAKNVLFEAGIPIFYHDTGGELGRKIYFNTFTGKIRLIRINYTGPEPTLD
jgi:chemotaxis protein CheD